MSLSDTTLSDFISEPETSTAADEDPGARPAWAPMESSQSSYQCLNCESTVTERYHAVNSDNDGNLWHCQHCVTTTAMKNGAGAMENFSRRCPESGHLGGGL